MVFFCHIAGYSALSSIFAFDVPRFCLVLFVFLVFLFFLFFSLSGTGAVMSNQCPLMGSELYARTAATSSDTIIRAPPF